jgi:hypothetical protein
MLIQGRNSLGRLTGWTSTSSRSELVESWWVNAAVHSSLP